MKILTLFIFSTVLVGQTRYLGEDNKCLTVTNATRAARGTNGNTGGMVITCAEPHGFDGKNPEAEVKVPSTMAEGDSLTIGSDTYTYKATPSVAGDIKRWTTADDGGITTGEVESRNVAGLVAAIMGSDSGYIYKASIDQYISVSGMDGTYYHADTPASTTAWAYNRYKLNGNFRYIAKIVSRTPGLGGRLTLSKTGTAIKWFTFYVLLEPSYYTINNGGTMEIQYYVNVSGASGSTTNGWARVGVATGAAPCSGGLNGDQPVSIARVAIVVDDDEFRLPAADSSCFPDDWATTQQANWRIIRYVNDLGGNGFPYFQQSVTDVGGREIREEGAFAVYMPPCTPSSTSIECGDTFVNMDNQKQYMKYHDISNSSPITFSSGVATIPLRSGGTWVSAGAHYQAEGVGTRVGVRGLHKYYETKPVPSVADVGGIARVTTTGAHNCVNGTDQAYIAWATGAYSSGAFPITVISTTVVELTGVAFAGTATGTLTCNPHGRQAHPSLAYFSTTTATGTNFDAFYKTLSLNSTTITLDVSAIGVPDGEYFATCAGSKCAGSAHPTYGYVGITKSGSLYTNIKGFNNDGGNSTDTTTYPNSKRWRHAKQTIPLDTPPNCFVHWIRQDGLTAKISSSGGGNGFHTGTYQRVSAYESGGALSPGYDLGHYYDFVLGNLYDGQPVMVETCAPVGSEGSNTFKELPVNMGQGEYITANDKTQNIPSKETGSGITYESMVGVGYFAFPYSEVMSLDTSYPNPELKYAGATHRILKEEWTVDTNEIYAYVGNRTVTYCDPCYDNNGLGSDAPPTADAAYQFNWSTKPQWPPVQFRVRWSASATPVRTSGWSAASTTGVKCPSAGSPGAGNGDSVPCDMNIIPTAGISSGGGNSYAMVTRATQDDHMRLAVRPIVPLMAASANGENTVVQFYNDLDGNAFQVGDSISLQGAGIRANGNYTIAEVIPRKAWAKFAYDTNGSVLAWTNPGDLDSIVCSGTTCTVDLNVDHGLVSGMKVLVAGTNNITVSGNEGAGNLLIRSPLQFSKTYAVTVTDSNSFTFTLPTPVNATLTNQTTCPGSGTACIPMKIITFPAWRLTGTNTGSWTGSGTVESNENTRGFSEIYFPKFTASSTPSITMVVPSAGVAAACTEGGSTSVPISFTSVGGNLTNWTATDDAAWLSLSPASGTLAATITANIDCAALIAGPYSATVTITSTTLGVTNSPTTANVSLTVSEDSPVPTLTLDSSTATWNYTLGGSTPSTRTVTATCTTPGCEVTRSFSGCSWLTVTPTSGNTPQAFTFSANVAPGDGAPLPTGSYPCVVTFTGTGDVNNSPQDVTATLNVSQPSSNISVSATASDTRALVRMRGVVLAGASPCTVEIYSGETLVASANASGPSSGRSVEVAGLTASTFYTVAVGCGVGVGGSASFTTKAAGSPGVARWSGTPPSGATKMQVQYGSTVSLGSTITIDCAAVDCVADVPRDAGRVLYLRRRWLSAGDAEIQGYGTTRIIY